MPPDPIFTWPGYRPEDPAHHQLQAFLVLDLQQSPAWTQEILAQVVAVQSQALEQWQRLGNAYALSLSRQGATIEDTVAQTSQTVSLGEFEAAVQAWLEQIQM
ncbi:MAG: hypothetical protein ACPGVO_07275 [Spirulinaceae cyanobacterium]